MSTRPLPRSLDPAPGELLPGFLLRLSHRLRIAPLHLAQHCGLQQPPASTFPTRHMLHLDPGKATALARSLRLSPAEIHSLTLMHQAPEFPPLREYLRSERSFATLVTEGWVFTRFSRYCPECLTEDRGAATPSWNGLWRLPMMVACLRHQRFLDWLCPDCGNPAFSTGIRETNRWRPASLVPAPLAVLHPAQCRSRVADGQRTPNTPYIYRLCGGRLDQRRPAIRPSAEITELQEKLIRLATSPSSRPNAVQSVNRSASASEHFNDLRAVTLLISGTWPAAAELFPRTPHLDATAAHIEDRLVGLSTRKPGGNPHLIRALDRPPPHAATSAALLALASKFLTAECSPDYISDLVARCDKKWPGRGKLLQMEPHCSTGFRFAAASRLDTLRPVTLGATLAVFPQLATHRGRLKSETVPQRLPDSWTETLTDLGREPDLYLRRDAAIRLVQMANGGTRSEAVVYLGFDIPAGHAVSNALRNWQQTGDNARLYNQALALLADQIASNPNLIDYHRRRDHLNQWVIPEEDWNPIIDEVHRQQTPAGRQHTRWTHTRRL
ncbi:TniQ family protein, partial [Streptomyces niveus]|uniref:TniQ family protein n=1 Tax=Streptomyces niveus TaxID=193462 RepID=UPI00341E735C